ncbi:gata transcription factor [Ophiostoma piceae UAMH 11346]|uniref:Gata transcription factor n=1 Tax=Ophiostoma piceae (strain UAMH 11346) TaxID=1262450 RepID=S3BUV8_OPHP1|nr:gata transcription factor [Ophiostoma piceae UAMH 11346]
MASPMTTGGQPGYGWSPAPTNQPPMGNSYQSETGEMGVQVRPMALKVHYTFDKDSKINCLARLPQNLQIQTVPLDERNWIGIVDIRLCIQAIAQGSPELLAQNELDYAIYATDFSEPDTPLVGQGMMSWVMDPSLQPGASQMMDDAPKMVTGRVTKNVLGLFGNGARETLEVRLKLSESPRAGRAGTGTHGTANMGNNSNSSSNNMSQNNMMHNGMMNNNNAMPNDGAMASYSGRAGSNAPGSNAPTPTDTTEWNSFMQSNPGLGRSASISTMYQSPIMMPARPELSGFPPATQTLGMAGQGPSFDSGAQPMSYSVSRPASQAASRPNSRQSIGPSARSGSFSNIRPNLPTPLSQPSPSLGDDSGQLALSALPVDSSQAPARPPRTRPPRSRATGRPRGRPKKRPATDGNTSAAEELPTDNDANDTNDANENNETTETPDVNDTADTNDGEDAHKKKRVKTTKVDYPTRTSLDTAPDSLRVAASTNGSLRTMRPVMLEPGTVADGPVAGAHLQEYPRAPTPVPVPQGSGGGLGQQHARKIIAQKARRESMADFDSSTFPDSSYTRSVGAHSPTDSLAPSPDNYTPEDSPADIGSSPPVPRTTSYVPQSSPMPSSPPLPPMRRTQPDSGFMSGGVEGLFDDDDCMTEKDHPPPTPLDTMAPTPSMDFALPLPQSEAINAAPSPSLSQPPHAPSPPEAQPQAEKQANPQPGQPRQTTGSNGPVHIAAATSTQTATRPAKSTKRANKTGTPEQFEFKSMEPGPPELLPTTILYNPPPPPPKARGKTQRASSMVAKSNPPHLERSNSAPSCPLLPAQPAQPSQLGQPRQLPFLLPSDASNSTERTATQPPAVSKPRYKTSAQFDVPNDMKELARLLAASADNDQDAVSLIDVANVADESSKSPGQSQPVLPQQPAAEVARMIRGSSTHLALPRATAVPASDPPALPPFPLPSLPLPPMAFSEAPCPPSDIEIPNSRSNKNRVRKAAIKEKLQKAIESGQMPTFCQNCGAIETPTWRKMWTQDRDGEPEEYEFSEKPGHVTALDILERDEDGKAKKYRLVKKALSSTDDGKLWTLMLLCNPCGIWLGKCKSHRPSDRWDKDASRLSQPKGRKSRSRKPRAKGDNQPFQPTSEAYFTTDPAGPNDQEDGLAPSAPITQTMLPAAPSASVTIPESSAQSAPTPLSPSEPAQQQPETATEPSAVDNRLNQADFQAGSNQGPASTDGSASRADAGSTHSRGSGTAKSPIAVDDAFGPTRRLLFPSPRKDGVLKVLGELAVNVIGSVLGSPKPNKEDSSRFGTPKQGANANEDNDEQDDMVDLFGTPPPKTSEASARPSTPPPRSGGQGSPEFSSGPFKTPTRPTPNHRPITRSVSKTIRSGVSASGASFPKSPLMDGGLMIQRTPSKTPRSVQVGTTTRQQQRRLAAVTPGRSNHSQSQQPQISGAMQLDTVPLNLENMHFDTPFTSTLNKLLSEANDFTTGSPSHGLTELDLASLANLDSDGLAAEFSSSAGIDFGAYLDTNMVMSSSSPHKGLDKHLHQNDNENTFGGSLSFEVSESMWSDFNDAIMKEDGKQ